MEMTVYCGSPQMKSVLPTTIKHHSKYNFRGMFVFKGMEVDSVWGRER